MVTVFDQIPDSQLQEPPHGLLQKATGAFQITDCLIRQAVVSNPSLMSGKLGLVLYYFTLFEARGDAKEAAKGRSLLEEIFEEINGGSGKLSNPSLSKGLSGFLYLIHYLDRKNLVPIRMKDYKPLEEHLFQQSCYLINHDFNDYLHGGFGALFYFLKRLPDRTIEKYVVKILELVFEKAVHTGETFWIRNFLTSADEKKEINLSLSHGQSGFLMIMLMAFEQGILPERIYLAVKKGIALILNSRQDISEEEDKCSFFPIHIKEQTGEPVFRNRLAWCYGDLNEVLLLYRAGHHFDEERYVQLADVMGTASVSRSTGIATLCADAHFCHGAAGIAHFYRTLFNERNLSPYLEAYFSWTEKTLLFLEEDLKKGLYREKETGLLDGLTGIALTLLSFITPKELDWSRVLLL